MSKGEIPIEFVQNFLKMLDYEWQFVCLKISDETFKVANSFSDVKCEKEEVVFLELYKGKKTLYQKFRISEERFQKIMSSNVYFSDGTVEDFSEEWKCFLFENYDCGI